MKKEAVSAFLFVCDDRDQPKAARIRAAAVDAMIWAMSNGADELQTSAAISARANLQIILEEFSSRKEAT